MEAIVRTVDLPGPYPRRSIGLNSELSYVQRDNQICVARSPPELLVYPWGGERFWAPNGVVVVEAWDARDHEGAWAAIAEISGQELAPPSTKLGAGGAPPTDMYRFHGRTVPTPSLPE